MAALYTHTTRGPGTILTSTIYNADHQNHIDNGVPNMLDDYSVNQSQCQSQVDPYPSSSLSLPTSLAGELERIRYQLAQITGNTYWYEDTKLRGWDHIQTQACGTAAQVDFELGFGGTYKDMMFMFRDCSPGNADQNLTLRIKAAGAYVTSGYEYHISLLSSSSALYSAAAGAAAGGGIIGPATTSSGLGSSCCGHLMLLNVNSTFTKKWTAQTVAQDSGAVRRGSFAMGHNPGVSAQLQGARFLWGSGSFQSGEIAQYGLRAA